MKKTVFLAVLVSILFSCENSIENIVKDSIRSKAPYPSSVNFKSIDILLDTVPFFLDSKLLGLSANASLKKASFERALSAQKSESLGLPNESNAFVEAVSKEYNIADSLVKNAIKSCVPKEDYIALVSFSFKNIIGETINTKNLLIIDKETKNVEGSFTIDPINNSELMRAVIYLLSLKGKEIPINQYNKVVAKNLPPIEKFILEDYVKPM